MNLEHVKTWRADILADKLGCDLATARKIKAGEMTLDDLSAGPAAIAEDEKPEDTKESVDNGQ